MTASAQTPVPSGQWKFDNPSDLMAATVGNVTLSPTLVSSPGIADATVSEAGIVAAEGFDGSKAILVPATSGLKVTRAEGATASTNFSFMLDLKVFDSYAYNGLFQTNLSNGNDADLFIAKGQIGAGAMGGYVGGIWGDFWYRVVFTNSEGSLKVYVNGDKVIDYATSETRWEIDPTFYLLADDDGEKQDTYISEVAFWETPLTDAEVKELGSVDNRLVKDLSKINNGDQFFIISDRAKFAGNSSGKAKAMSTMQAAYTVGWGDSYVYWGDLNKEADGYVWTVEKVGDQFAFLNKENGKYLGNMNTGEADIVFSDTPIGYTLTDLTAGAGRFFMTNDESEHSPHVQGYKMNNRPNNSLAKQNVGDDDYSDDAATCGYPGRWRLLKLNTDAPVEPVETGMKIETEADFVAFAAAVNNGETDLEAYLVADIVLTDNTMVGTSTNKYAGTFDGKGHSITYNYTVGFDYGGLFSYTDGATIKNLRVEGTAVVTKIHFGALLGRVSGTNLIENVITNVNITGQRSGVTGDGGMCGRNDGIITYNYCATLGKMGYEGSSMYSPFNGYSAGTTTLNNCYTLSELTEGTGTGNCYTMSHSGGTNTYNNSYYLTLVGSYKGGIQTTAEQVASGELCYLLNGDQSTIGWYQTLGVDAYPVPFPTSEQVYANGELKCDGTSAGGTLVYSNSSTSTIPPHTYEGGWCSVCGGWDASYELATDGEGFSLIANAKELAWFAEYLAKGNASLNVKLTADIDLTTSDFPNTMIASEANRFKGIFDGQGHTITYNYNVSSTHQGLFRSVEGATIRNLFVQGEAISTAIHFGALIGQAYGTVLVENVVTDVDITGKMNQVTGIGGMLGANYADITFNNCATLGTMGYSGSSMYSSFAGWANGESHTTLNNCFSACELTAGTIINSNSATLSHAGGPVTFNNCYYLNFIDKQQGTQVTAAQIAGGSLCYKLNGDQSVIAWTQAIGTDAYPMPDPDGQRVYASGTARCDGAELADNPFTYTNTESYPVVPDHQFGDDDICTVCGTADPNAVEQDADGFYLIGTPKQLNWFATKVQKGTTGIKARLTADIDLTTSEYPDLMVGTEANPMQGIFDGAGYTITYSYANVADKWRGLFAFVKDATIRNLYVEGDATVSNIHFGALIGHAEGTVLVENVITNVDITGTSSTGVQGDGGMLGANYADNITFNNCATLGKMGNTGTSMYSSFSAWSLGTSSTTLNNCYSLCELTAGTGEGNCFTLTHQSGTITINNSYYLNVIGKVLTGDNIHQSQITAEQVANGELCAMLGAGWYQNIGTDAYPVFDKTHNTVKVITDAGYATMYIPDAVEIPAAVEVFTGEFEDDYLKLNAVTGTVPALEPVILKGAAGIYSFAPATTTPANIAGNVLKGAAEDVEAAGKYILAKPDGEPVGFYKATIGTIKAGKAYLESGSGVKVFYFVGDESTGIAGILEGQKVQGAVYNLAGQRLSKMQKGINIVNGKKILK